MISGKTTDGIPVIAGIIKLSESQGIPLTIILQYLKEKHLIVDWIDYIDTAIQLKWNPKTALTKAEEAITEIYNQEYASEIIARMKMHLYNKWK